MWPITQFVASDDLPAAVSSSHIETTGVGAVEIGLEFKGLRGAGVALIGRRVETLTCTVHSQVLPLQPSSKAGRKFMRCAEGKMWQQV